MPLTPCPYCTHGNPANAKFCNECGGTLSLAPCPHCGAVNEVGATACYACRKPLKIDEPEKEATLAAAAALGSAAATPVSAASTTESTAATTDSAVATTSSSSRGPARFVIVIALIAIAAVAGYLAGRSGAGVEAGAPVSGSTAATGRAASDDAGAVKSLPAVKPQPAVAADTAAPAAPTADPHTPLSLTQSSSLASPGAPTPCTEAVAALGLCTPSSARKPNAATAAPGMVAREDMTKGSSAPCTQENAVLGLCKPTPTQRKE